MTDPKLQRWWRLQVHDEVFFLDRATTANITSKAGLWDLGNRWDTSRTLENVELLMSCDVL
jgi:hypothetical protein